MKVQLVEKYFAEPGSGFPKHPVVVSNYTGFATQEKAKEFITSKIENDIKRGCKVVIEGETSKVYPPSSKKPESYHFWYTIVED